METSFLLEIILLKFHVNFCGVYMIFFSNNIHQFVNKKKLLGPHGYNFESSAKWFSFEMHPKCHAKCPIPPNTRFRAHLPPCVSCLDVTKDDPLIAPCQCKGSIECPPELNDFSIAATNLMEK